MSIQSTPIDRILAQLKRSKTITQIPDIDITWGVNNNTILSSELLLCMLTKTCCVPLTSDFTNPTITQRLGIDSEQAKMVQGLNSDLIYIQGLLQKMIITNFVLSSISKQMIDDVIDALPETDISQLLDFIKNFQQTKEINEHSINNQKGGQNVVFIKSFIFLFFLLCIASSNAMDLSLVDPTKKMYSSGLISYTPEEFTSALIAQPPSTTGQISVSKMISKHDEVIEKELKTMYGQIMQLLQLSNKESGSQLLEQFIEEFNVRSSKFSRQAEESCLDLMVKCNEHNVFSEWTDIDTLEETEKKNQLIENLTIDKQNAAVKDIKQDALGLLVTAASSPFTGDITSVATYATNVGEGLWDYFSATNNLKEEKKQVLSEQQTFVQKAEQKEVVTATDKKAFESKIYDFSKIYCSYGYNLKIVAMNNTIVVEGDNVPYASMIQLIETLDGNLHFQINKLSTLEQSSSIGTTKLALESIQERLGVLKAITQDLKHIINTSGRSNVENINKYAHKQSMQEFKDYFNSQLTKLQENVERLNLLLPAKEKQIKEDAELQAINQDLIELQQNATAIARQRNAELSSRENADWFNSVKTIAQSWADIGLNTTQFTAENLGKYAESLTNVAIEPALGLVDSLLKFLNKLVYKLFTNPAGWVVIIGALLAIEITVGGIRGTIRVFKSAGQLFVTIVFGPVIFVYKLVKTQFGYMWSLLGTYYVDKQNYNKFLQSQEEGELYDPSIKYGGKKRTHKNKNHILKNHRTKRTHKNKKHRTRKHKYAKKHITRRSKSRMTK